MLTLVKPEDLAPEALLEAVLESAADLARWAEWYTPQYGLANARSWMESQADLRTAGAEHNYAIIDDDGRFLGGVGINQINVANRFANLGYWVRSSATGRGVAAEAARTLAAWAFAETDLERLEIVVAVGNQRSQRAAEKTGAVREGMLRSRLIFRGRPHDAVMYSIIRRHEVE